MGRIKEWEELTICDNFQNGSVTIITATKNHEISPSP